MVAILRSINGKIDIDGLSDRVDGYLMCLRKSGMPMTQINPILRGVTEINDWVGEVRNGGHSQFVGNKGPHAVPKLKRALVTAKACCLDEWVVILRGAIDWIRDHPTEALTMTGFQGGISHELEVLDRKFYDTSSDVEQRFIDEFLSLPGIRFAEEHAFAAEVRADVYNLFNSSAGLRNELAEEVAEQCRNWLSNRENVAFSLACGKSGFTTRVAVGPLPIVDTQETYVFIPIPAGTSTSSIGIGTTIRGGFRFQTGIPPETGTILADVSKAEIDRAQKMALAFRLPESVGLRWSRTGREFIISKGMLQVMPGATWSPKKWRILWSAQDWAVKGSPKLTTFADLLEGWKETLTQDQLSAGISDARLDQMSRATPV